MQIYPTHEELSLISKHSTGKRLITCFFFSSFEKENNLV